MKYAALACYFGQWPAYFAFWLKSCAYNPDIDFLLVTDIPTTGYDVPRNVRLLTMSFADLQQRVRTCFPTIVPALERPYKICDFRPAYGQLFREEFSAYDYWGWYDLDTIWGDISAFIPDNADGHLVKIFPCGHLSFVRNLPPYDQLYRHIDQVAGTACRGHMTGQRVATWQSCLASPQSHYYDEEGGVEPWFTHARQQGMVTDGQLALAVTFDNVLPPWRFDHFRAINSPDKSCGLVYSFEQGHLFRHYVSGGRLWREEISYLHLSRRPMRLLTPVADRFCIYPNVFAPYRRWTLPLALLRGRPRYLANFLRRLLRRLSPQQ